MAKAKGATKPAAETQKNDPPPLKEQLAANEHDDLLQQLLRRFDDQGVSLDEVQWRKFTDPEQRMARVWVEARENTGVTVIPSFLEEFSTPQLKSELQASLKQAQDRRVVLMPCIFKNPGYAILEGGGLVIKLKLRLPDGYLGDRSAKEVFGKKHVHAEICRRPFGEWGQQQIVEDGDRRTIAFDCDISSYGWSDDHYLITIQCAEDNFSFDGRSGIDEAIGWAGKQGSVRLTILGDIKGGEDPIEAPQTPAQKKAAKANKPIKNSQTLPGVETDETYQVSTTPNFMVQIRLFPAPENKFGCEWTGTGPSGTVGEAEPSIRVSAKEAVVASIGRASEFWSTYSGDEERDILADIKHWLSELEKGKMPKMVEAEMSADKDE